MKKITQAGYKVQFLGSACKAVKTRQAPIRMQSKGMVNGLAIKGTNDNVASEGCLFGKQCRKSFPKRSENRARDVLEVIHSDDCDPMEKYVHRWEQIFSQIH